MLWRDRYGGKRPEIVKSTISGPFLFIQIYPSVRIRNTQSVKVTTTKDGSSVTKTYALTNLTLES